MTFKVPEKYRDERFSTMSDGNNGVFFIPGRSSRDQLKIIASDGLGWEHVSVSKKYENPSWDEMNEMKNLFWSKTDWVMQFHPAEEDYVNHHPYCLHLWRPTELTFPVPKKIMV